MTVAEPRYFTLMRIVLGGVIGLLLFIFLFCAFHPAMPVSGLDASWVAVTGEAAARPTRWGADLTFTYGPAAPLVTSYYNDEFFSHSVPLFALLSAGYGLGTACLLLRPLRSGQPIVAVALSLAMIVFVLLDQQLCRDFFFLSLPLAIFLLAMGRRDRLVGVALVTALLALGVTGVTKTSYMLINLPLLALLDARQVARGRWPFFMVIFGAGFLFTYLFYHQNLSDLPIYLSRQFSVASGYADAMNTASGTGKLIFFLCAGTALIAAAIVFEKARPTDDERDNRFIVPLGMLLYVFVLLKTGFIRYDDGHTGIALTGLGIGGLLYAARLAPRLGRTGMAAAAVGIGFGLSLIVLAIPPDHDGTFGLPRLYSFAWDEVRPVMRKRLRLLSEALSDIGGYPRSLNVAKREAWRVIREARNLPELHGTVDVIQSEQSAILASGMTYRPRPSFQEYSTYTAELIAANQAFFEGPRAPDWIVFAPGSIDNRYPASAEGASWPDFLRLYAPVRWLRDAVALHRREQPLPDLLGPVVTQVLRFGDVMRVEPAGPVFARIHVRRNLLGQAANILFRPRILAMVVRLRNGEERRFRFIPALGEAGFVLSPLIATPLDFTKVAIGAADDLKDHDVVSVAIDGAASSRRFFAPDVQVELQTIDSVALARAHAARPVSDDLDPRALWRDLIRTAAHPLGEDRLLAPAPTELTFPVMASRRVRFGYGIVDDAWTSGRTKGVCFAVERRPSTAPPLWERCLDPVKAEADRGEFTAAVDLPPGSDAVVLATRCRDSCASVGAYWSRFEVD